MRPCVFPINIVTCFSLPLKKTEIPPKKLGNLKANEWKCNVASPLIHSPTPTTYQIQKMKANLAAFSRNTIPTQKIFSFKILPKGGLSFLFSFVSLFFTLQLFFSFTYYSYITYCITFQWRKKWKQQKYMYIFIYTSFLLLSRSSSNVLFWQ